MKKKIFGLAVCLFVVFTFAAPGQAFFGKSNIEKANEFVAAGMYPQAIALLQKEIGENPTNAEAHFQLAVCYVQTGEYDKAEKRFASAVRLDSKYGFKIGGEYKTAGDSFLAKKKSQTAIALYAKAVEYDRGLKGPISQICKLTADAYLSAGDLLTAELLYRTAMQYNSGLKKDISRAYKSAGDIELGKGNLQIANALYKIAVQCDPSLKKTIAKAIFAQGQESKRADIYYSIAVNYDEELTKNVVEYYITKIQSPDGDVLRISKTVTQYRLTAGQKRIVGKRLAEIAVSQDNYQDMERYLKIASKFISQEELFSARIKYYSKKLGPPKKIELRGANSEVEVYSNPEVGDEILWLSSEDFIAMDDSDKVRWKSAVSKPKGVRYLQGEANGPLRFKKITDTTVYVWKIRRR